jgi:hypothetical protein
MTDIIEHDAIANTPDEDNEPWYPSQAEMNHKHAHEEMKTFIATPRQDSGFVERIVKWFKGEALKPGMHIVREKSDGLRLMTIITSNSYEDREKETITSEALKAYEASCYPGEDLFHCDNPLLWWHDDDIVMGEIIAVNYSEPFLIEVARELPNPVSKTLFDFAEQNGDKAGASHRFGYLEKDRDPDGTYHRIFKQETSYLPERSLAANDKTYAGVVNMASPQSDKLIDQIFEPIGIKNAAAKFHAKTGEIDKEFEALGLIHKALPPTPPKKPIPPVEADAVATTEAADMAEDMVEEEDDKAETPAADAVPDMQRMLTVLDSFYNMLQTMMDAQAASEMDRVGMMKSLDELKETRMAEKSAEKVTIDSLEAKIKALEERVVSAEKKLSLAPRSVTHKKGGTADELKVAIDKAEKSREEGELIIDPFWGPMKPLHK